MEQLISLDRDLFLYLNSLHSPFWDTVMVFISGKWEWVPLYAVFLGLLMWQYKWKALYAIIGIALVITAADLFTSGFMKPFFARPRPCHDPALQGLVHTVNKCGGKFGFASSHAANSFGLATFLFSFWKGRRHGRWAWLLFLWAGTVSYSRIYLGVHFPGDILVGGAIGIFFGWAATWPLNRFLLK